MKKKHEKQKPIKKEMYLIEINRTYVNEKYGF